VEEKAKPIRRKTTITFSIDSDLIDYVEKESKAKGTSLNALMNSIITKYIFFHKPGQEVGIQFIPKKSFLFLINRVDELEHAKHIEDHLYEFIQVYLHDRKLPLTLENVMNCFFEEIAIGSGAIDSITHYVNAEGNTIIVFKHSYEIKWSNTNCIVYKNLFERLLNLHIECEPLPNSIIVKILEKNISY
jgi:hypothetical protein